MRSILSFVTAMIEGKTIKEALTLKSQKIIDTLELPPEKHHCAILMEDALAQLEV